VGFLTVDGGGHLVVQRRVGVVDALLEFLGALEHALPAVARTGRLAGHLGPAAALNFPSPAHRPPLDGPDAGRKHREGAPAQAGVPVPDGGVDGAGESHVHPDDVRGVERQPRRGRKGIADVQPPGLGRVLLHLEVPLPIPLVVLVRIGEQALQDGLRAAPDVPRAHDDARVGLVADHEIQNDIASLGLLQPLESRLVATDGDRHVRAERGQRGFPRDDLPPLGGRGQPPDLVLEQRPGNGLGQRPRLAELKNLILAARGRVAATGPD